MSFLALAGSRPLEPNPIERRAQRCGYAVVEPKGSDCRRTQGKQHAPCSCGVEEGAYYLGELLADGGYTPIAGLPCELRADDKARKAGFTQRVCLTQGARCSTEVECCAPQRCFIGDTGGHCEAPDAG